MVTCCNLWSGAYYLVWDSVDWDVGTVFPFLSPFKSYCVAVILYQTVFKKIIADATAINGIVV